MTSLLNQSYKLIAARKFSWLFVGRIVPVAVLFLITIIYSRELSYDDYGTFQSVWMYANIINIIISFGLSAVIFSTNLNVLFTFIKSNQKKLTTYYSILWVAGFACFFFLAKNFDTSLKVLLIFFMIVQNITTAAESLLIKRDGEKISAIINFFYGALFFAWHIYILLNGYSLYQLILGITILSFFKLIIIALIPATSFNREEKVDKKQFSAHWVYLGFTDVAGVISKWIDKVFLLYLLTATDFAIFFNGAFEIPLFGLLVSVTGNFLLIEISKNTSFTGKITRLFSESFNVLSAIVFPLFFFLLFFRNEIYSLAFNDKYNASLPIFVICIFILPLRINNYSVILQCFSQGKKILFGSLLDISIAIILMLILYPWMGMRGIAIATVVPTFCQIIYYLWHSAKILKTSIFHLVPVKQLAIKFAILLVLFFLLSLALAGMPLKIKLIIALLVTGLMMLVGIKKFLQFRIGNY